MTGLGDYAEWAAAGLTSPSGSGLIGPSFGRTLWSLDVPTHVEVIDGHLQMSYDGPGDGASRARKPDGALDEFVTLPDDSDETFASFARRWGCLGLCRCGWPAGHPSGEKIADHGGEAHPGSALRSSWSRFCWAAEPANHQLESLADWRQQYHRLRTILTLAAAYRGDKRVPFEAWQPLIDHAEGSPYLELLRCYSTHDWDCGRKQRTGVLTPGRLCGAERHDRCPNCWVPWCAMSMPGTFELGRVVDEMLDLASVRLQFSWLMWDPEINVDGGDGLMPQFALQLAMALQRSDHLAICSECGSPHLVSRAPNRLRRVFCTRCREDGAPQRRASRDYRARKRQALLDAPG